ncbi:pentapeptide repeat-containing protein [Streptomyces sp. NPDC059477]|uniref:pentapeptide repeat-containing protein n=1 Tax=Streptomyces sp. NPDC059477 TaxID=3346847 RepID=UPI003678F5C4
MHTGAQLDNVDLRWTVLNGAIMAEVHLAGANLSFADLTGVDLRESRPERRIPQ